MQIGSAPQRRELRGFRNGWSVCAPGALALLLALLVAAGAVALPTLAPADEVHLAEGELRRGDTVSRALRRAGVGWNAIKVIEREFAPHFDFRRAQPGQSFEIVFTGDDQVLEFVYELSSTRSLRLVPDEEGYVVAHLDSALVRRVAKLAGTVTSTVYQAVRDLGEDAQLAMDFTEIFAWDLDFSRSVRPGDEFRILYERVYSVDTDGNEHYRGPGRILAASYQGAPGNHTAVYFEGEPGRGGYFAPDGSSVQRSLLRAPLRYSRISSHYSTARRHPILNVTRPHHGIDYAAPYGTPVWAVASGEVIFRGRAGGFGKLVKIRHANGYVSYYSHLSRFPKGLRVGSQVQQKQVVGYVGATGLATGPHVCFRLQRDGKYVDPARVPSPSGAPVPETLHHAFYSERDRLLEHLGVDPAFTTQEAM